MIVEKRYFPCPFLKINFPFNIISVLIKVPAHSGHFLAISPEMVTGPHFDRGPWVTARVLSLDVQLPFPLN